MAEKPPPTQDHPTPVARPPKNLTREESQALAMEDGLGYLEQELRKAAVPAYKKHGRHPSELVTDPLTDSTIAALARHQAEKSAEHYEKLQAAEAKARDAIYDEKTREERVLRPGALAEALQTTLSDVVRTGESVAILMVDADHFRNANEKYGHIPTDDLLRSIAKSIRRVARRQTDIIGRFGGEEFLVILKDLTKEDAIIMANAMRENYSTLQDMIAEGHIDPKEMNLHQYPRLQEPQSMSIGITFFDPNDPRRELIKEKKLTPEELGVKLQKEADKALYFSKETGRDRVTLFDFNIPLPDLSSFEAYKSWVDRYVNSGPSGAANDTTSEAEVINIERERFYRMYGTRDKNTNFAEGLVELAEDLYKPSKDPLVNKAAA